MQFQLVRNATFRIDYASKLILTDPALFPKRSYESFAGISPNPIVDLPMEPSLVVEGAQAVMLSHLHPDHIDQVGQELLPKDIPLYCQPVDAQSISRAGFTNVRPVESTAKWESITITRTPAQHGSGATAQQMGPVSGFFLEAEGEPSLYWASDTIWYEGVMRVLEHLKPDIIITHSGGAMFPGSGPIIMDAAQTVAVCNAAPDSTIIAVHLEALDHCTVTREGLREYAEKEGISSQRLLIPADGETISL